MTRVLVTGGTGFIGSHVVVAASLAGHEVRTTVRDVARSADVVRAMVREGGADPGGVEVVAADLTSADGWDVAVDGCDVVLHVASPIPLQQPDDPQELVGPARDGTLRVLHAARRHGVRRVVLTSSFAAIGYGRSVGRPWTEDDWTDPAADLAPYPLSKTVAERAAWDLVGTGESWPELVALNPTGVFGPMLGPAVGSSAGILVALATGAMAQAPRQSFGVCDVRDLAEAHVRAIDAPVAGLRVLLTSPPATSWLGLSAVLREHLGDGAAQAPTEEVDGPTVPVNEFDVARARDLLGWTPRPAEQTIRDSADSLVRWGLLAM